VVFGTKLGLLSLLLAVATTTVWFYLTRQVALPDDRSGFVVIWVFAASIGIWALIKGTSLVGGIPPSLAIIVSLFLTFTVYISPQKVEVAKVIKVGDIIPRFQTFDDSGIKFDSNNLNGHLVLIKFFRAHW
jgi:hypothetical protein